MTNKQREAVEKLFLLALPKLTPPPGSDEFKEWMRQHPDGIFYTRLLDEALGKEEE